VCRFIAANSIKSLNLLPTLDHVSPAYAVIEMPLMVILPASAAETIPVAFSIQGGAMLATACSPTLITV
jgi:hypothetical protein